MKKLIMPFALVLAVAGAFATKSSPTSATYVSIKPVGGVCTPSSGTRIDCNLTGTADCTINNISYFNHASCVDILKKQ